MQSHSPVPAPLRLGGASVVARTWCGVLFACLFVSSVFSQVVPPKPTHADVKYGPHARNAMDVWLPASDKPTPVMVCIHGGGFINGDKSQVSVWTVDQCMASKIAMISINYRFSGDAIAPAAFLDAARAVQFIRQNAAKWNIDPQRIATVGGSAGGSLALWLAFHDDLADPKNEDPVLRQSTRVACTAVIVAQTTLDPRAIKALIPECDTYKFSTLPTFFGVDLDKLDSLPPEKLRLFEEVSPINHVTRDDPPALLIYSADVSQPITSDVIGIHHARFGKALKDKMDPLGVPCELVLTNAANENVLFDFVKKQVTTK